MKKELYMSDKVYGKIHYSKTNICKWLLMLLKCT